MREIPLSNCEKEFLLNGIVEKQVRLCYMYIAAMKRWLTLTKRDRILLFGQRHAHGHRHGHGGGVSAMDMAMPSMDHDRGMSMAMVRSMVGLTIPIIPVTIP